MKRRDLVRALALAPLLPHALATPNSPPPRPKPRSDARRLRRTRPSDPSWPSAASWTDLQRRVGGQLIRVAPLFGTCIRSRDTADCREASNNIANPYWIADQPAGTEISGWLDAWAPAPSAYALRARNAADVAAGVDFARAHNLRVAVKGGAHSYQGTSSAPDSLLIWTRSMTDVQLHDSFVGNGCDPHTAAPAVSAGAGAVWMDLYDAVTTRGGRYVQGGSCLTVGVAGLIQSGGFNSFSKAFGSAAAGLLEAELVTADGQVRVVNACRDPELFWAIKGGGGGTFGVLTRVTVKTHDLPTWFGDASGKVQARSDAAFERLITRFLEFYREQLFNPHWGEHVHFAPDNTFQLAMQSQGLDAAQANEIWRPFFDWITRSPDYAVLDPLHTGAYHPPGRWSLEKNRGLVRDERPGAPAHRAWDSSDQGEVGAFLHAYDSLWLPSSLLGESARAGLTAALFAASRYKLVRLHINKALGGAAAEVQAAARQTATNPAMIDAFTLVIIADGQHPAYPSEPGAQLDLKVARQDARAIAQASAELRKLVPDAGSYVSESNYFNPSWQDAFWGENYPRLRAVKRKYDPDGLFIVHHGVGSEDWSPDGFTRLSGHP
jgi:FAD/FMN-containing dehydrogenase